MRKKYSVLFLLVAIVFSLFGPQNRSCTEANFLDDVLSAPVLLDRPSFKSPTEKRDTKYLGYSKAADFYSSSDALDRSTPVVLKHLKKYRMSTAKNLEQKVKGLSDVVTLSQDERKALEVLVDEYFQLEVIVHRVKGEYLNRKRFNTFFRFTNGTLMSTSILKGILRSLSENVVEKLQLDYFAVYGIGSGMESSIDRFYGSEGIVSTTLELFDSLDGVAMEFRNTGIAIVYGKEVEKIEHITAVNAPDEEWFTNTLLDSRPGVVSDGKAKQWLSECLTVSGLRVWRKACIMREGLKGRNVSPAGAFSFFQDVNPFTPSEISFQDFINHEFVAQVVVADGLYATALESAKGTSLEEKVVSESEYFKRDGNGKFINIRLRKAQEIKEKIIKLLAGSPTISPEAKSASLFEMLNGVGGSIQKHYCLQASA